MLTSERTVGQIGLNKNGSCIDIWIRIDGEPRWFSVLRSDLDGFLASENQETVLQAGSDGNSEADFNTDASETMTAERVW